MKLHAFSLLLGCAALSAQTKPCVGLNDTNNTVVNVITARSSLGPGEWGWQYTATNDQTVHGLRVYTGNKFTTAHMEVAIWSHDATAGTPAKKLAKGHFYAPKTSGLGWWGANLDQQVKMKKGTSYWITWIETGWSTPPFMTGGTTTHASVRRFTPTGGWTKGTAQAFKCRLYCSPIDVTGTKSHGAACSGASTGLGTSFSQLSPMVGNADFRIEGTGFPANAAAFLALGRVKAWPSVPLGSLAPGCFQNTDYVAVVGGKTGTGNIRSTSGPSGHVRFDLAIPNNAALKGVFVGMQIAAADAGKQTSLPLVFSNATQATIY